MSSTEITLASSEKHLNQILALQLQNHKTTVNKSQKEKEGFVTVRHDIDMLTSISGDLKHVIAVSEGSVVGYALVMQRSARNKVPILIPMFEQFDQIRFKEREVSKINYIVMGQVCVAKEYRSMGIFRKMYKHLADYLRPHFELILTDIDLKNKRSIEAHKACGWIDVAQYHAQNSDWQIVGLEL